MDGVNKELCEERHRNVSNILGNLGGRITEHGKQIDELTNVKMTEYEKVATKQASITDQILLQLTDQEKRIRELEQKPQKRLDYIINVLIQCIMAVVIGVLAAKTGLV